MHLPTGFLYDDLFLKHLPGRTGHPECAERLMAIRAKFQAAAWMQSLRPVRSRDATEQELSLVHAPEYLALLRRECAEVKGLQELSTGDTIVSRDSLAVAQRAAGGV